MTATSKNANIFLIGPMGAGKTTVGKRLAEQCGLRFLDADHELEVRCGVDIAYIFEKEGEPGFRRREVQVLESLTQEQGIVLATGGGVILDADNRRILAERGRVIYLHASVDQQLARTARSEHRPLLKNVDRRATLERLLQIREPLYREIADLVLSTDGCNSRSLVHQIHEYWRKSGGRALVAPGVAGGVSTAS